MTNMSLHDAAMIQRALDAIPEQCRYHGANLVLETPNWHAGDACCDTGRPSMYRKFAEEALKRAIGE